MSETTLAPVTFVRDVVGDPYLPHTSNKLWVTQDNRHVVTSYLPRVGVYNAETLGLYADEQAYPDLSAMSSYIYDGGADPWVEAPEPAHEAVLAILGYKVAE